MAPAEPNQATAAGQGAAKGLWKTAIQQVQDINRENASTSKDDALSLGSTPSIIQDRQASAAAAEPVVPKLAVMVHRAFNLPGSKSGSTPPSSDNSPDHSTCVDSSNNKGPTDCYYVRVGLHSVHHPLVPLQQRKTEPVMQASGHVCWPNGLLQLEPHGNTSQLEVLLQLKRRIRFTGGSVVVGSARVPLSEVVSSPEKWGTKQQLQLSVHRTAGPGRTTDIVLEVQLFLATSSVPTPLQVLCATWNVGNALPPPPEQLQEWLKGADQGEHHLIAVAAQECNYFMDMRRYMSQHKRSALSTPADGAPSSPTAAKAAAATGRGSPLGPSRLGGAHAPAGADAADDAPLTPTSAAGTEGTAELLQEQVSATAAAAAAVNGDALLASHKLGSTRAALKARLVDAVDSSAMWERHVSNTLGEKYWLVGSRHMFQTRLLVFARADVVPSISHISSGFEATGIGHVGVNKGGVAVGLKVGSTHVAFVGSHLAAHQSKTQQRNTDVSEICHELDLKESFAAAGADLVSGFHHVVWMGDLNYRLEYGQQAVTHSDSPTPEDFASLCDEITSQRFGKLLPLDQLMRERDAGRVFFGFREGLIDFAPTFKVLKGEQGFSYDKKRSPGWCDRVLFKSVLPHKQASCSSYYTVPDICSSDHKPVAAVLSLPMATHTVAGAHRYHPAGRSSGTLSPQASNSPSNSSKTLSPARSLSPINSWSSSAAAKLARLSTRSLFPSRRSNTAGDNTLYKLYLASVCLGDQETWHALAALAGKSRSSSASRTDSSSGGREAARQDSGRKAQVERSSSGSGGAGAGSSKGKLRLQLVVSGACMAGIRYQQVMRLSPEAICAACTAEDQPSLLLREDSIQLLPGALSQLTDDWLLMHLVLSEGWRSKRTLARGILPLQPVVAAYRSSYKAVPVTLQLESDSAAVGSLVCNLQLISSASIRAGMHEAIRRMRAMAADTRSASQVDAAGAAGADKGAGGSGRQSEAAST